MFQKLVSGDWDLMQMLDVFAAAGAEQRLYGWFAREEEEQVARELGIDGAMKADNVGTTEVGIFLNDAAREQARVLPRRPRWRSPATPPRAP